MPRTLTDIIPPSRRRQMEGGQEPRAPFEPVPPPPPRPPKPFVPRRRFPYGTAIGALVVIALVAGALYYFAGAKIQVTAATNTSAVNATFTATQGGDLPFQVISVTKEASTSVPAESTDTVHQAAQGTITIYNAQTKAQTLVTNTRFETPDGLVFRIHSGVTVPAGTATTPGSVQATVYADATGDRYNVGPTSFTLPGLSGSPEFTKVYAKSTTSMAGGFEGSRPTISQATETSAQTSLQSSVATSLQAAITAQIPQGYVLIPGASYTSYTPEPDSAVTGGSSVSVNETGTMQAVVFPESALASAIAYQVVGSYAGQPLDLKNPEKLTVKPTNTTAPSANDTSYQFALTGDATLVWKVDASKIAAAVAGKTRDQAKTILNGYPEINQAYLVLRPFWRTSFPTDPAKISVEVQ